MSLFKPEVLELAEALQETDPYAIFELNSLLNIPYIYNRWRKMIDEAERRFYQQQEMIADGSRRRTLGGCWFIQVSKLHGSMAKTLRNYYRENTNTPKSQIPTDFLKELH